MAKIGLVAGSGSLPLEFAVSVKAKGDKLVVFALEGVADDRLGTLADKVYRLKITQYKKFFFLLVSNGIRELVMLGKFEKRVLYERGRTGERYAGTLGKLNDRKDYSILREITRRLAFVGVRVVDPLGYVGHLLPPAGVLTALSPDKRVSEDIEFGYEAAKNLACMDVGQTVIIKNKTVVAVEAMEGTDATIERASSIAGEGCVMVKVARPGQDMRWDVPVIGPETVRKLAEGNFSALAIEKGKMFVVDRDQVVSNADSAGISIQVLV
jgi:UDP-2,3-diacylglucosamine hydrolase